MTCHPAEPGEGLRRRLESLYAEGRQVSQNFNAEVRSKAWHPFVAANYESVERRLLTLRRPGLRFLEWGSATGVITIMADLLGFDACGIELDPELVAIARDLADRFGSGARFAAGSFFPAGYTWTSSTGDARLGTIGEGVSGYSELGTSLDAFDVVFAYPWSGEEPIMHDVMARHGGRQASLLLHGTEKYEYRREAVPTGT